jgi:ubiquinone/menaquinone biosynthesis C-methylase UbiE
MVPTEIDLGFDAFAEEYDASTRLQDETGLALIEELGIGLEWKVLDVGSGSRYCTQDQ